MINIISQEKMFTATTTTTTTTKTSKTENKTAYFRFEPVAIENKDSAIFSMKFWNETQQIWISTNYKIREVKKKLRIS